MAGRRPKPTAIRRAEGNRGHRKLNTTEPQPEVLIPDCPKHLDRTAREEWDRVSVQLYNQGLITELDRSALAAYCAAYSLWVRADTALQNDELLTRVDNRLAKNHYLNIQHKALDTMRKFAVEFGMTPAARSRVTVNAKHDDDADLQQQLRGPELTDAQKKHLQ